MSLNLNDIFAGKVDIAELPEHSYVFMNDFINVRIQFSDTGLEFIKRSTIGRHTGLLEKLSVVPEYDAILFQKFINNDIVACECICEFYKNRLSPYEAGKLSGNGISAICILQEIAGEYVSGDFYKRFHFWNSCRCEWVKDINTIQRFIGIIPPKKMAQAISQLSPELLPYIFNEQLPDKLKSECVKRLAALTIPKDFISGEFTLLDCTPLQLCRALIYLDKCLGITKILNLPTVESFRGAVLPILLKGKSDLVSQASNALDNLILRHKEGLSYGQRLQALNNKNKLNVAEGLRQFAVLDEAQLTEFINISISVKQSVIRDNALARKLCRLLGLV